MEQGPGALNGTPSCPRECGQRARELCLCQESAPSHSIPCSLQQRQDLHPYSEMSVLTRPHLLGSQVVRRVSPVRLDGELWVSGIMLAPWGSQLLSEGRNPGQGALRASEAGAQVLPAALLGGGISEQKGEGRNSPAQD